MSVREDNLRESLSPAEASTGANEAQIALRLGWFLGEAVGEDAYTNLKKVRICRVALVEFRKETVGDVVAVEHLSPRKLYSYSEIVGTYAAEHTVATEAELVEQIESLVKQINGAFKIAKNKGLKVWATTSQSLMLRTDMPESLSVHISEEREVLNTAACKPKGGVGEAIKKLVAERTSLSKRTPFAGIWIV